MDTITSDVMFEAYGKDPKELFENAASALFSVICKINDVKPKSSTKIEVKGEDMPDLMISWLQCLIATVDTDEKFFSKFSITKITDTKLIADIYGESITPELGDTVVKAVTYYKYKFEKKDDKYIARISLDI